MDAPEPSSAVEGDQEASVLGNLPRTRPSVRSPRREDAQAKAERSAAAGGQAAAEAPDPPAGKQGDEEVPPSREREIEELAKAGLSLAGGAATLGLKAAGRAAQALRGAVERR